MRNPTLMLSTSSLMTFAMLACHDTHLANADLEVGQALSLEWLVDSADVVFEVQLTPSTVTDDVLFLRAQSSLKGNMSVVDLQAYIDERRETVYRLKHSKDDVGAKRIEFRTGTESYHWSVACKATPLDRWYLFVRTDGHPKSFRIFYAMNLSRPREFPSVAAILGSGKALTTAAEIVLAVRSRVSLKRLLPKVCQRELIDNWTKEKQGIVKWANDTINKEGYWSRLDVDSIRGGFAVDIDNSDWDDIYLHQAIVPATAEFQSVLLRKIDSRELPSAHDTYALLNYPGVKTEALLSDLLRKGMSTVNVGSVIEFNRVLTHLRFRENLVDPLNEKLIGPWQLHGRSERIDLDLRKDGFCTINTIPLSEGNSTPRPLTGRGYWGIHNGHLWIARSHVRNGDDWELAVREFFPLRTIIRRDVSSVVTEGGPKRILSTDEKNVILNGGPKMTRPKN